MDRFPPILLEWADRLSAFQKDTLAGLQKDLAARTTELALADSREKTEHEMREQEKSVYTKTLQDQARIAALENEHLRELVCVWCLYYWLQLYHCVFFV